MKPHKSKLDEVKEIIKQNGKDYDPATLKNELYAIAMEGLEGYFLDLHKTGKTYDNPSNSLVAWLMGITDEEPSGEPSYHIKKGRQSLPDIDIDIDDRMRDKMIDRCREVYGESQVANIATFGEIKAKSAIKDASRALGYDYAVADKLNAAMPPAVHGVTKTIREALETDAFYKLAKANDENKEIVGTALKLEGLIRQSGVHAAGVVVTPTDVVDYVPVMQRKTKASTGPVVTQFDMGRVEEAGLLKLDFLGLRNLGVIDMCLSFIEDFKGEVVDIDNIPLDDPTTYHGLCEGNAIGLFQVESSGLRRMMMAMQPDCIEDIMALIALYRPGPLGSDMDKLYIDKKHGRESFSDMPPAVEKLLESTQGVMLYQENILAIAREIAGYSAFEADALRKILGKKLIDKMDKEREKFIQGCNDVGLITESEAYDLFGKIEHFGAYGFNAAHSASYGLIAYQTAYLKFNYPTEYMAALLSSVTSKKEKTIVYLNECRRMDIDVLPPSINESQQQYSIRSETEILMGLESINGLGDAKLEEIFERREKFTSFDSLYDFFRQIGPQSTTKTVFQHLVSSGALDEILPEQDESVHLSFRDKNETLRLEREELGMFVTQNPLMSAWHLLSPHVTLLEDLEDMHYGFKGRIGGIITQVEEKKTRRNQLMYIIQLEDVSGGVECVIFPRIADSLDEPPAVGDIVFIDGKLKVKGDEENVFISITVDDVEKVYIPETIGGTPYFLEVEYTPSEESLFTIANLIVDNPGDRTVYLTFPDKSGMMIKSHFKRPTTPKAAEEIKEML